MKKISISAILLVYNTEKTIKVCLDSIKDFVDEIIIVHNGHCHDNTIKICSNYTDKIYIGEPVGTAEPQRNFTFLQAKGDWILQIDGDEFITEELKKQILKNIKRKDIGSMGSLWCPNKLRKNTGFFSRSEKSFIWRKEDMTFVEGAPHSIPQFKHKGLILGARLGHNVGDRLYFFDKTYPVVTIHAAYNLIFDPNVKKKFFSKAFKMTLGIPWIYLRKGILDEGIIGIGYVMCQFLYYLQIYLYVLLDIFHLPTKKLTERKNFFQKFYKKTTYTHYRTGKVKVFHPGKARFY
tara:strand:+ start:202 stop:1080 length:879 start_codon:yes stop_codon:yes gene_type:complete